jgi:hypothetical protein
MGLWIDRSNTWSDYIECIKVGFTDNSVEVGVDHDETRASAPMSEKAGLNIVMGDFPFDESVVVEEDHSCEISEHGYQWLVADICTHLQQCNLLHA